MLEKNRWLVSCSQPFDPRTSRCHYRITMWPPFCKRHHNDVISSENLPIICSHYAWCFCIPIINADIIRTSLLHVLYSRVEPVFLPNTPYVDIREQIVWTMFECTKLTFCNVSARVGLLQANTILGDTLTKTSLFAHEYLPKQSLAQETGWPRSRLLNASCQTKLTPNIWGELSHRTKVSSWNRGVTLYLKMVVL